MASYHSSFNAPSRPEPGWKPPRPRIEPVLGGWAHSADEERKIHRETDIAHLSGAMDTRTGDRLQTQLTNSSSRGTSPAPQMIVPPKSTSAFGFRMANATAAADAAAQAPVLKGKSSRNTLRRKQSSIAQRALSSEPVPDVPLIEKSSIVTVPSRPAEKISYQATRKWEDDVYKNRQARRPSDTDKARMPQVIPELDRYGSYAFNGPTESIMVIGKPMKLSTHDLPPPTPGASALSGHSRYSAGGYSGSSAYTASPATHYTESPGSGPYSRDTTPTSMSSQSSGILAPSIRMTPRLIQMQPSPKKNRPPLSRRRTGSLSGEAEVAVPSVRGLPSLRESSLTSSSSGNSTVKNGSKDSTGQQQQDEKKRRHKLAGSPPNPPQRKSSRKFKKNPEDEVISPTKLSKAPARAIMSPATDVGVSAVARQDEALSRPPTRPSRENTPSLGLQFLESPIVIQSNLSSVQMSPERRRSSDAETTNLAESSLSSRLPVRDYSPSPSQPLYRQGTPAPTGFGIVPSLKSINTSQARKPATSRSPSPASTTSGRPRFGFLGRRTKTAPEAIPTLDVVEKSARKGPAAGTGHEGYGRYAMRGRSNSAAGRERSQSQASSSQDSYNSQKEHDLFLLERTSPIIIAGGGEVVENRNNQSGGLARTESNQSLPITSRPSTESRASSKSTFSKDAQRTTLWPSGRIKHPTDNTTSESVSKSYLGGKGEASVSTSSLAIRRSIIHLDKENEKFRLPAPIKVAAGGASSAMSSQDTTSLRTDGTSKSSSSKSTTKKLIKRPGSPRRWNIFKRSNKDTTPTGAVTVPVVVAATPSKPVAYYEIMDSSEEQMEGLNIEDILRDAEVVDLSKVLTESPRSSSYLDQQQNDYESSTKVQRPAPEALQPLTIPKMWTEAAVPTLTPKDEVPSDIFIGRPSRLAPVGRIPKVVSVRPKQTSPKSFSRPFARVSMMQPTPQLLVIDRNSIALGPSPERSPSPSSRKEPGRYEAAMQDASSDQSNAFLVISPRKDSTATASSSSQSMSMPSITAIIPEADAALEEDEIWDEYDDLVGNADDKVPVSATSSHGVPFQYEGYESRRAGRQQTGKKSPVAIDAPVFLEAAKLEPQKVPRLQLTSSSVYSPDLSAQVKEALGNLPTPSTPFSASSFSELFAEYGERNNSITGSGGNRRLSAPSVRSSRPSIRHSKTNSIGSSRNSQEAKLKTISEQPKPVSTGDYNLRLGSMTVSKWLTFGHVLFNPAREDFLSAEPAKNHSILVLDGLGNDDWSFYAAETYPAATFYNLSPSAPPRANMPTSPYMPMSPTNHKQVQQVSPTARVPFPREFFSCVVIRFPSSSSENILKHLISEAKRVLKPSGYLELSILDLDMVNMGTRCRRALRALKTQLATANPSMSLGSASDTVLREIGKKGFTDVKSCRVGVPVASIVKGSVSVEPEVSLADMMKDESEKGDGNITKMVADVGRWWWRRCYENAALPNDGSGTSMWEDEKLLQECEKWTTSFKLLVCYAQKPLVGRRRTASV